MENRELVEKRLKKSSSFQLVAKLEKSSTPSLEKEVCIEILSTRGQDVSKWKTEVINESVMTTLDGTEHNDGSDLGTEAEKLEKMKEEVDQLVDQLISEKRSGVYSEIMKALGGKFESDIDELLENATEEQLRDALAFRKISKPSETPKEKKEAVKKVTEKTTTVKKKEVSKSGKTTLELYVEKHNNDTIMTEDEIRALDTKREKVIACWFSGIKETAKISEIAEYAKANVSGIIRLSNLKK